jgi:hypothetical protein
MAWSRKYYSSRRRGIRRARRNRYIARWRRKRRTGFGSRKMFLRTRNPFSVGSMRCPLHYYTTVTVDGNAGNMVAGGIWQFSANCLYDPDVTSIGHQPMYFDNLMEVFKKYRVKKTYMTVTVVNHTVNTATANSSGTTTTQPNYAYRLAIWNDSTQGSTVQYPSNFGTLIEEGGPSVKWRFVGPSLTGKLPSLRHSQVPYKQIGCDAKDPSLTGTVNSCPTAFSYMYVGVAAADGSTNIPPVSLAIKITYVADFWDRDLRQLEN